MRLTLCAVAALVLAAATAPAPAADSAADLIGWIPERANTLLLVDADAVQKSDMATRLKWAAEKGPTHGLESLPPNAARLAVGCQIDPDGGVVWEVMVAAQRKAVGEAEFVKKNGGTKDTVGGRPVVLTERYGIAAVLAPGVAGAHQPPNRQEAGRWLRGATGKVSPAFSPYLKQAAARVGPDAPVVLAFDTTDMLPQSVLKTRLGKAESLKGKDVGPDELAELFAAMKGVTLTLKVTDHITGEIRLDFTRPAGALKDVGKPLLLEVLDNMGVGGDELGAWTVAVTGNTVTFRGGMTRETAGALVAPFLRPSASALSADSEGGPEAGSKAEASVRYYKAATKKVGEMKTAKYKNFSAMALSYNTAARFIDELPILNVDEDLQGWGGSLTTTLRSMAIVGQAAGGQISMLDANRSMSQITTPNYYYGSGAGIRTGYWGAAGYGYNYAVPTGAVTTNTVSNYGAINNQVMMTNMQEHQYRLNTWKNVDTATNDIRRKMVAKYQVEF